MINNMPRELDISTQVLHPASATMKNNKGLSHISPT